MDPRDQQLSNNFGHLTQGQTSKVCPTCSLHVSADMNICPNDGTSLSKLAHPKLVSNLAGQYEFICKIGEGGMGVIYKARHLALNHLVAIKMMHVSQLDQTKILRFQQEAKAVSTLDHPSIVRVRDFGISEAGQPHMVLDFIDGVTLDAMIKTHGPLSLPDVKDLFSQICDAVAHAHQRKVLHRDLKPSNIMLVYRENICPLAVIVDFGIAKVVDPSQQPGMNLTQTGEIFGSPFYMSPEQTAGKELDHRSDIYSVGCVLYEALTGAPPFVGHTAIETLIMHTSSSPPSLKEGSMGKVFPPALQSVVDKALAKDPKDRFQDMTAFKVALIRAIDETSNDLSPAFEKKKNQLSKSHLALIIMASICSLAVIGAGIFLFSGHVKAGAPSSPLDAAHQSALPAVVSAPPVSGTDKDLSKIPDADDLGANHIKRHKDDDVIIVHWGSDKMMSAFDDVTNASRVELLATSIEGPGLLHLIHLKNLKALVLSEDGSLKEDGLERLELMNSLEEVNLYASSITDHSLNVFSYLPNLRICSLATTGISGQGLYALKQCKRLQSLDLGDCKRIHVEDLNLLQSFPKLSFLNVSGLPVQRIDLFTDKSVSPLRRLYLDSTLVDDGTFKNAKPMPSLREISLAKTKISAAGLQLLADLAPGLTKINLSSCAAFKSSDLKILQKFKVLKKVELEHWDVNDAGLTNLMAMPLTEISFAKTKLSDSDLLKLAKLTTLTKLDLTRTKVTVAGAEAFAQALPTCNLLHQEFTHLH